MAGIVKLLDAIGEENIGIQDLRACMSKSNLGNKKSTISFETDALTLANSSFKDGEVALNKTAILCWVDTGQLEKAIAELKSKE